MARPTQALIDRQALRDNFAIAQAVSKARCMPMVKANAYGHGAEIVCRALENAPAFGVASIEEALELRRLGVDKPILLLEGTFSADEITVAEEHQLWLMVENHQQCRELLEAPLQRPISLWLGLDTGMHRLGFQADEINAIYQSLATSGKVQSCVVLASHLASADHYDDPKTRRQIANFDAAYASIAVPDGARLQQSLANSAALLGWPKTRRDWQRPGYMLYGNSPFVHGNDDYGLRPVMTFVTAVTSLRSIDAGESVGYAGTWTASRASRIATLAVGYGDGYPRHAPNGTPVLINGRRCPLIGRVSMDMLTVDITDCPTVNIGDQSTLWGPDLPVNEIAEHCATNGYQLLSGITARVPRIAQN